MSKQNVYKLTIILWYISCSVCQQKPSNETYCLFQYA